MCTSFLSLMSIYVFISNHFFQLPPNKYLLRTYSMSGTALGSRAIATKMADQVHAFLEFP